MKRLLCIIQFVLACNTATNFAMDKGLENFKHDLEKNVDCACSLKLLYAYQQTYKTIQQSIEKGAIFPNVPNWFIADAHGAMVLKKNHPESYFTLIRYNLPLAQGDISPDSFEKVTSIFHPIVLSMFSIPFQQYLIETRNTLLKLQNINDFNTLTTAEKNMFTVALLNLSYKQLKQECETILEKLCPYYEVLKNHTEKIYKLLDRMRIPEPDSQGD